MTVAIDHMCEVADKTVGPSHVINLMFIFTRDVIKLAKDDGYLRACARSRNDKCWIASIDSPRVGVATFVRIQDYIARRCFTVRNKREAILGENPVYIYAIVVKNCRSSQRKGVSEAVVAGCWGPPARVHFRKLTFCCSLRWRRCDFMRARLIRNWRIEMRRQCDFSPFLPHVGNCFAITHLATRVRANLRTRPISTVSDFIKISRISAA